MKDDLGKRMKGQYESRTRYLLPRRTYTMIRLDGKAFHTFTQNMDKPYDRNFIDTMNETAKFLCANIQGAVMSYTQSDEISILLTDFSKITTDAWFDGNIQKIASVSASMATAKFNQLMSLNYLKNKYDEGITTITHRFMSEAGESPLAFFDARVWTIPDPIEVENYFIWRQKDATRNSIAMHAQSLYSHKELEGKSQVDMQDMIHDKDENWNNLPEGFKRGRTYYQEVKSIMSMDSFDQTVYESKEWKCDTPDFSKQRELLTSLIPKIS